MEELIEIHGRVTDAGNLKEGHGIGVETRGGRRIVLVGLNIDDISVVAKRWHQTIRIYVRAEK